MSPKIESITLDIEGRTVSGIRQYDPSQEDAPNLLCIHGWIDNANSFVPIMPYLPAFNLVAIDLPGCGYSSALPQGYSLHDINFQLHQIISKLDWEKYHVLAHSLGACIAPMLAVNDANRIQTLSLIEGIGPMSESADKLPARMKKAMQDRLESTKFQSRLFASKDDAINSRLKAAKMAPASAKLIIDRQVTQDEDGFRWRFDPAWRAASWQYQTEEQVESVLGAVDCPVLAVIADKGFLATRAETGTRLACIQNLQQVTLPGYHHLHMDTPGPVAAAVNQFLETLPALGG